MIAGAAKVDITPDGPVWMEGMIRAHPSTGVHDPIFARVLCVASDADPVNMFVIASLDIAVLSSSDAMDVRTAVAQETGIPVENMILAATHSHSGPATIGFFSDPETDYVREMKAKLVDAIMSAANDAKPAAVGIGIGREDTISHYRRLLADDGHVVMNWEPWPEDRIVRVLGEPDPRVYAVKIVDAESRDKMICLLFNHAGHPNVMSGDNYLISGDYAGFAESRLEDKFGGVALFVNGAQGSVDIDSLRDRDWKGVERAGNALASVVEKIARETELSDQVHIRGSHVRYDLPPRKISDTELCWARDILRKTGGSVQVVADGIGDDYKAKHYLKLHDAENTNVDIEQVCIAIGDTAFVSFPGELFTEIGVRIDAESPFSDTCIIGLANGYIGYVPTQAAVAQGGYEVDTRGVATEAEQIIVENSLGILKKLSAPGDIGIQ